MSRSHIEKTTLSGVTLLDSSVFTSYLRSLYTFNHLIVGPRSNAKVRRGQSVFAGQPIIQKIPQDKFVSFVSLLSGE